MPRPKCCAHLVDTITAAAQELMDTVPAGHAYIITEGPLRVTIAPTPASTVDRMNHTYECPAKDPLGATCLGCDCWRGKVSKR
jgi:hypothetical protein